MENNHNVHITEMRCPGCGSTLRMPPGGAQFVRCEYCGGEYAVNGLQGRAVPNWRPAPSPVYQEPPKDNSTVKSLFIVGGFVLLVAAICAVVILTKLGKIRNAEEETTAAYETADMPGYGWKGEAEEEGAERREFTGLLGDMISTAFGKDANSVTPEELSRIKWVADKSDFDYVYIGYSFEDPLENPDAELEWLVYPDEIGVYYENGYENLSALTGLKKLETRKSLSECSLRGLKLESLTASIYSMEEAALAVEDTSLIKELGIENSIDDLSGLEKFPNVEKLSIYASDLTDISAVTAMPHLRSLTLENADELNDFAVFGSIENLEELIIESENIKALNFLDRVPQLKSLGIADGELLDLSGLEKMTGLEKLSVTDCDELQDMKAVENLTGLKELTLENPYDCEEPSLGALTGVESLSLSNFHSCGFLQNLTNLKELRLESCDLPEGIDLSGLTQLKELTCTTSLREKSFGFVGSITSLESVNMRGIVTYDDISGVFALPNLKELDISGAECEINFSKVAENPSLESLEMADMTLYENVSVSGGGGIVYVDWDYVYLAEHLDFLASFPNLKKLNIAGNEIKDISFAESLGKLEEIDFSDNYVTEIRPLAAIPSLKLVNCKGNPVSNLQALGDKVVVISE